MDWEKNIHILMHTTAEIWLLYIKFVNISMFCICIKYACRYLVTSIMHFMFYNDNVLLYVYKW